jgi:hypothetical protein
LVPENRASAEVRVDGALDAGDEIDDLRVEEGQDLAVKPIASCERRSIQ